VCRAADAFEPFGLLKKHHLSEPQMSIETAVLLMTDRRWRGGVAQLVQQISESGMLDDEELIVLAQAFLAADDAVYWEVPDQWFGEDSITIDLGEDEEPEEGGEPAELEGPAVARRDVWPPPRRWAAGHELARDPAHWPALLARAGELTARDGAAVMSGMMDRVDVLSPAVQAALVERARTWPHHGVRRAAFEFIQIRDGAQTAYLLARDDLNAKVREWAATLDETELRDTSRGHGGAMSDKQEHLALF
jgi:hypothetical protein